MSAFTLGFLLVVVIPLAEGVILALVLREVHNRHPLPLGGAIVPMWWKQPKPVVNTAESASSEAEETDESSEFSAAAIVPPDLPPDDSENEQEQPPSSRISFFDGVENIPTDLPIGDILEAMTKETPAAELHDFENIIDESSLSGVIMPEDTYASIDDMDEDDLQALMAALPGTKIDFAQDTDPEEVQEIQSMNEELLGEHFDYDALEQQSQQIKESLVSHVPAEADTLLEIRENEPGTVQVSSPFVADVVPQLADFISPVTIVPMFDNDWIQESGSMTGSGEEDATKFCFTEESRPMLARKKRKQG